MPGQDDQIRAQIAATGADYGKGGSPAGGTGPGGPPPSPGFSGTGKSVAGDAEKTVDPAWLRLQSFKKANEKAFYTKLMSFPSQYVNDDGAISKLYGVTDPVAIQWVRDRINEAPSKINKKAEVGFTQNPFGLA